MSVRIINVECGMWNVELADADFLVISADAGAGRGRPRRS